MLGHIPSAPHLTPPQLRSQAKDAGVPILTLRSLTPQDLTERLARARQLLSSRRLRSYGAGGVVVSRGRGRRRPPGRGRGGTGGRDG